MTDLVLTEDRGAVRHVVLNRPEKRNAFNEELVLAVGEALRAAADDPSVHCVVLRGEGADVLLRHGPRRARRRWPSSRSMLRPFRRACLEAWNLAEEMTKPVVCQIHGACIGGAMELALACDLRVIAADALVGMPETRVGLIPDVGGSSRLPQVVGLGRAKELIMTGRADRRRRRPSGSGSPTASRPPSELEDATQALVDELLACAPVAVGLAKRVDGRLRPPGAVDDARARGRDAGAVRALGGLRGGRERLPREAPAAVHGILAIDHQSWPTSTGSGASATPKRRARRPRSRAPAPSAPRCSRRRG